MIVVGLVVEGPHDYITLTALIEIELAKRSREEVRFRQLQPLQDATGAYAGGGWSRVIAWCQANAGSALDTHFTPLFAGEPPCNIIVVHMDGDALEAIAPHTNIALPKRNVTIAKRVSAITSAIEDWLALTTAQRSMLAMAIPVLHTESWLLCAEGHSQDCEKIDAKDKLRKLHGYAKRGGLAKFYKARADVARTNASKLSQAESYVAFQAEIAALSI